MLLDCWKENKIREKQIGSVNSGVFFFITILIVILQIYFFVFFFSIILIIFADELKRHILSKTKTALIKHAANDLLSYWQTDDYKKLLFKLEEFLS